MKTQLILAQIPVSNSIEKNIETIETGLEHAQEGEIVVFPEGAVSGYETGSSFLQGIRIRQLEAALERLRSQARERKIHLWVGSYLKDGEQWFNAALGFTPNGGAHQYRKINLASHERGFVSPGSDLPVFELEVPGGTLVVGVQICREIRFPEQWGWLAREGAQVIFHLNNAVNEPRLLMVWRSHLVSHAAANQRYVISVNTAAALQTCPTLVVSPEGWVLEEIQSDKAVFKRFEIDLGRVSDHYLSQCRRDVIQISTPDKKERRRILRSLKLDKLQNDLDEVRSNPDLYEEVSLSARTEALEFIHMLEDMYALRPRDNRLESLYRQGRELRQQLEKVNNRIFARLRGRIKLGETSPDQLRQIFSQYTDYRTGNPGRPHYGYENLDGLVSGVFFYKPEPDETLEREPGMVRYQSTPASVILEMVDEVDFKTGDVFYDLGSGLGLVVSLVHVLTGVPCVGVEYQPAYCQYAEQLVKDFGLSEVFFINRDVRQVDLSGGSVFYLFNPFGGQIFDVVMANLRTLSARKTITVCSYGPCTEQLASLAWLEIADPETVHDFKLAIFRSKISEGE